MPDKPKKAFILRIKPSHIDRMQEALDDDDIIMGWSHLPQLLNDDLEWTEFRQIIHDYDYSDRDDYRASGRTAGELWRFIREMTPGDLVVTPHGSEFYVAEVVGSARHEDEKAHEDTAFRRQVRWLNGKNPIPRNQAPAALYSRMKIRGTSAYASDLRKEIEAILARQDAGQEVTFESDLHNQLIQATVDRLRNGFINERQFERIIATILTRMGASSVRVIEGRQFDEGADVLANFRLGRTTEIVLAVQAKFYKPDPPVTPKWVDQLRDGMVSENADLGWLATTGNFSSDVEERRDELLESEGIRIELVDAEELATLIIEHGVSPPSQSDEAE